MRWKFIVNEPGNHLVLKHCHLLETPRFADTPGLWENESFYFQSIHIVGWSRETSWPPMLWDISSVVSLAFVRGQLLRSRVWIVPVDEFLVLRQDLMRRRLRSRKQQPSLLEM